MVKKSLEMHKNEHRSRSIYDSKDSKDNKSIDDSAEEELIRNIE